MDLMNLTGEMKSGRRLDNGNALSVSLVTPVARASFASLVEAKSFKGSAPRYGLTLIFNRDPGLPASIDAEAVLFPAFKALADLHKLKIEKDAQGVMFGQDRERERCRSLHFGQRFKQEDGTALEGYDDSSLWMSAYKRVQQGPVPCFGPNGAPIDPASILSGYYVRAKINPYKPKNWSMISIGLVSVQLIAEGPTFGGATDAAMDAIEGEIVNSAADFSTF